MSARTNSLYPRVLLVLTLCAFALVAVPADATPADEIKATRENAAAARETLDELSAELELAHEEFLQVSEALSATRGQIARTESDLDAARAEQAAAEKQLNGRAANIYRDGSLSFVEVLLGAADYRDLVSRLDLMRFIGRSDASLVVRVTSARKRIEGLHRTLEMRHTEQIALREEAASKHAEVERARDAQRAYLDRVNVKLKRLIAAEKLRREREAARRAAEIAARSFGRGGRVFDPAALGAPHPGAVAEARRYVGRTPYLWGGTTPAGFDCSGLVQYCYDSIGIEIPRNSRTQYRFGAFIPPNRLDLLAPGDLVFFGYNGDPNRVHHVAMFIGGGKMIHAPQAGERVSVDSLLERIERRGDYVGATRP